MGGEVTDGFFNPLIFYLVRNFVGEGVPNMVVEYISWSFLEWRLLFF